MSSPPPPPPPYKTHEDSDPDPDPQEQQLLASTTRRVRSADEEYGFWGEEPAVDFSQTGGSVPWRIRDIACAVVYAVVILVLVLNVDVVVGWLGLGGRDGSGSGNGGDMVVKGEAHMTEVYLCCLGSNPADACNAWRVTSLDEIAECEGGGVMILAMPANEAVLQIGDKLYLDAIVGAVESAGDNVEEGKFVDEGEETTVGETEDAVMPDDLAEEGMLRLPVDSHMHAGFGGPWRSRLSRG